MPVQPAHNALLLGRTPQRLAEIPFSPANAAAQNPVSANPIWRRPTWTYVQPSEAPRRGPLPRLSMGTGGVSAPAGQGAQLPGYLVEADYQPVPFTYQPGNNQDFLFEPPKTIKVGDNGRAIVGTYEPHDFTPGQRFFHHMRSGSNWQAMLFPPNVRNLLQWQQAQRYRINSLTFAARPLDSSNYFLGYQINPQVSSMIGQNPLGYMGSL